VFAALWLVLALIPKLALFAPIKKWAALGALAALAIYLAVSGASVPAARAFVMAAIAFGAVLVDRPAISLRALGAALAVIILIWPESVVEPGFQMSFAATGALVALFEARARRPEQHDDPGLLISTVQRTWTAISGVLAISLIAGFATDPFALFHFQRITLYGLPANLAAAPLTSFVVAPAALAAAVLAPFGWAQPALQLMADALLILAGIGRMFADRPEAVASVPAMGVMAFAWIAAGVVWACVWRGATAWGGVGLIAVGLGHWAMAPAPIAAFDGEARTLVFRAQTEQGGQWFALHTGRPSSFLQSRLAGAMGVSPARADQLRAPPGCVDLARGCLWSAPLQPATTVAPSALTIAYSPRSETALSLCAKAQIVIVQGGVPEPVKAACKPSLVIDATDRGRHGGGLIRFAWAGASPATMERARDWAGARIWSGRLSYSDE
jgi:competence protein ComEC